MQIFFLLGFIAIGYILARQRILTAERAVWGSTWIVYVALPAVALLTIPKLHVTSDLFASVASPVIVFGGAVLAFFVILKKWFVPEERLVLALLGGLGNTSFLGFPFISYFYGNEHLSYAVVLDQANFLLLATVAQYLLSRTEEGFSILKSVRSVIFFPPFVSLVIGFCLPAGIITGMIEQMLKFLQSTISPVAMMIVGFQIARFVRYEFSRPLVLGILYKLLVAPILVASLLYIFGVSEYVFKITVVESAMAPMITIAIIVSARGIAPHLTAQFLCWGILISFLTVPTWFWILEHIFQL